jgi:hypothetical protein
MTEYTRGQDAALTALFYSAPASPVDVSNLTMSVISLADSSVVLGPETTFGHPSTGVYTFVWSIPSALPAGQYLVLWSGDVAGTPISANEEITVTTEAAYTAGPCEPWEIRWPQRCDLTTATPEITGIAAQMASEVLYALTGQRFSLCTVTLRPCREECYGLGWPGWNQWWQWGTYPQPYWYNGTWFNMGCGQCGTSCSCTAISETLLPGPINSVVEVKVDGVVLVNGVDYRVDDYRKLVRLGAVWPYCNDLNQPDTAVGTWSATVTYGEPVPMLGKLAAGELACYFLSILLGADCELPPGVTDITRQGISMSLAESTTDLLNFYQRFPVAYLFIKTYNPQGLLARAKAYDLDGPDYRAVGTA